MLGPCRAAADDCEGPRRHPSIRQQSLREPHAGCVRPCRQAWKARAQVEWAPTHILRPWRARAPGFGQLRRLPVGWFNEVGNQPRDRRLRARPARRSGRCRRRPAQDMVERTDPWADQSPEAPQKADEWVRKHRLVESSLGRRSLKRSHIPGQGRTGTPGSFLARLMFSLHRHRHRPRRARNGAEAARQERRRVAELPGNAESCPGIGNHLRRCRQPVRGGRAMAGPRALSMIIWWIAAFRSGFVR